jgi:hypothetical protein
MILSAVLPLLFLAFYGAVLVAAVLLVQSVVRISHASVRISESLERIASKMDAQYQR